MTSVNPEDVYKYINVAFKDKDRVKLMNADAIAFDGQMKKWFIKKGYEAQEHLYKAFNPQFPVGVSSSEVSNKRKRDNDQVTPSKKVKIPGSLSASVLNNVHVKNLVINIEQTFATEEKLHLSPDQVRQDLECEIDPIYYELKETIMEDALNHHFKAFTDDSCVKHLLDYFVGVASSKQAETLATIGSGEDDDEECQNLKKQLALHRQNQRKRRRQDVVDVGENSALVLQMENDNLQAMVTKMKEEMISLIKAGKEEVQSMLAAATPLSLTPSSSVTLPSSPKALSSSSSSSLTETIMTSSSTTTMPGVTTQQIAVLPIKTIAVKVEKNSKSSGNNLFVVSTWIVTCFQCSEVKK
jgi:hypothetical protein